MGYSVLYIAFGIVALWLLGEVLLQYKARLRWRLLAFAGFMGLVGGVALREVIVIVLGATAFGTGQAFVTLSYKRGFSTGWALGGRPGSSRRRKGAASRVVDPNLEVTPVEEDFAAISDAAGAADPDELSALREDEPEAVHRPVPMHDDSGQYPLYDSQSSYTPDPYTSGGYEGYGAQGYAGWGGDPQPAAATASYGGSGDGGPYDAGYDQTSAWGGQGYGYDPAAAHQEQPVAAYGPGTGGGTGGYGHDGYDGHDGHGGQSTGDWTPQHQPQPQHQDSYQDPQPTADSCEAGMAYGYDPQAQPYIPQQPQPYQQQGQSGRQQGQQPQHTAEHAEPAEYADPYDPYRY